MAQPRRAPVYYPDQPLRVPHTGRRGYDDHDTGRRPEVMRPMERHAPTAGAPRQQAPPQPPDQLRADEELARRLQAEEQQRHDAELARRLQREEQVRAYRRAHSGPPGMRAPGGNGHIAGARGGMDQLGPMLGMLPMMAPMLLGMQGIDPAERQARMTRAGALWNMFGGADARGNAPMMLGGGGVGGGGPVLIRIVPGGGAGGGRANGALGEEQFRQLLHRLFLQHQGNRPVGASQTVINAASNEFEVDVGRLAADARTCLICQSDFENGERARSLQCFHFFHKDCIDRWLRTNKTCPVCRADIEAAPAQNQQRQRPPAQAQGQAQVQPHPRHPHQYMHPQPYARA